MNLKSKILLVGMLFVGASADAALQLKVITSSPEGFLVTSTLVMGEKDAVLIDGQFTKADAQKVVAAVKETKKNLTTIYVTHSHPDHYFGLNVLSEAFPKAKMVALPATIEHIKKTAQAKVDQWRVNYGDKITSKPIVPEELAEPFLLLEGERLEIEGHVQGDDSENSFVWIPSLKAVIAGDVVYDGVFPWTAETSPAQRKAWIASLDRILALQPSVVVPGHQAPFAKNDTEAVLFTKEYLTFFDKARASSKIADELHAKVKGKFPRLELDIILKIGAGAALPATR